VAGSDDKVSNHPQAEDAVRALMEAMEEIIPDNMVFGVIVAEVGSEEGVASWGANMRQEDFMAIISEIEKKWRGAG
jgi:hypothetical protein